MIRNDAPPAELRAAIRQAFDFFSEEMVEYDARRREIRRDLSARYREAAGPTVDLREHSDFAGLLVLDPHGARYLWEWGGVCLNNSAMDGFWVPLDRELTEALNTIGPDTHRLRPEGKAPIFAWEKFEPLLAQYLPGWQPAYELEPACDEAFVLVRCSRDLVQPDFASDEDILEAATRIDEDFFNGELARSPFANRIESFQAPLVGALGVLIWENSD